MIVLALSAHVHLAVAVVCAGKLPQQPLSQLPALLLRESDDVRHDSPGQAVGAHVQGRPRHPAHGRRLPRSRPPRVQQHVSCAPCVTALSLPTPVHCEESEETPD